MQEPEEASEDIEGMRECNPSITDDSGVCDWLRSQQAENIERLMKECEADDDKEDMSLTGMDDPSDASGLLESVGTIAHLCSAPILTYCDLLSL